MVHVFSHIRKTYRVQWIIVNGGLAPPKVLSNAMPQECGQPLERQPTKGKRKTKNCIIPTQRLQNDAIWIPLDEVAETK